VRRWLRRIFSPKRVLLEGIRDSGSEWISTLRLHDATGMSIGGVHVWLADMEDRDKTVVSTILQGAPERGGYGMKVVALTEAGRKVLEG